MFKAFKKPQKTEIDIEKNVPRLHDLFSPDGLEERFDMLALGASKYCRVYVLTVYPREISVAWLDRIFSLGSVDLSVHVDPIPDRKIVYKLTEKVASAQAQRVVDMKAGNILRLPYLENVIGDLESVRSAIQTNRERMFYVTVVIALHAFSEEELERKSNILDDILARNSAYLRVLVMRQVDGLKSALPVGNLVIQDYNRNLTTGGVAAMMPVSNPDLSHPGGVFIGYSMFTGAPVFYNSFIGPPHLPNQHMACFGFSGSGKSTALKILVARSTLVGIKSVIIDPEGEYRSMVEKLAGGEVVKIAPGRPTGINPLDLETEEEKDGREVINITDKVSEIRALFSAVVQNSAGRGLDPREAAMLEESLREEYDFRGIKSNPDSLYEPGGKSEDGKHYISPVRKKMPTLSDLYKRLIAKPGCSDLAVLLKPFLAGSSLGMFDCQTSVNLNAPVVCFDLSDIRDEFTRFYATFVVLGWAWQKFAQKERHVRKRIVVDEAWMFMKYNESAEFLEIVARRGRKHNTSLLVASQHIEEFLGREKGRAVISNCATIMLLRQSPTVIDDVVEAFHLASGARRYLEDFVPGECLLSLAGATTAVRISFTQYEQPFVTTTPGESAV
ncbi:MAG: DUF87 domain-containing protein [Dehalococcoidia bacterium]|nr:MAG: DUF87 domain-containing protein [Dehalococcoidia bacterium]